MTCPSRDTSGMTFAITQYGVTISRHEPNDDLTATEAIEHLMLLLIAVGYDEQSVERALDAYARK